RHTRFSRDWSSDVCSSDLPLEGPREVTFGRDESSDGLSVSEEGQQVRVGIPFGWVSGRHAELRVTEVGPGLQFSLRDLGSRNGTDRKSTRLNSSPVKNSYA